MARVAIQIAESALTDLESIRSWYAEQDVPEVGERLIGKIVASIEALAEHPNISCQIQMSEHLDGLVVRLPESQF